MAAPEFAAWRFDCNGRRAIRRLNSGCQREIVKASHTRPVLLLAAFVSALTLSAAASQAPARGEVRAQAQAEAPDADSEWTYWTSGRYRVTPGDVLEIAFPYVADLNQIVSVQPDGYISLK